MTFTRELMAAAMWAGVRNAKQPAQIRLGVEFADVSDPDTTLFSYEVIAGFPTPVPPGPRGAFPAEPQIKEETLSFHFRKRATRLLERRGPAVFGRNPDGKRVDITHDLMASETALGAFDEPQNFPEVHAIRQTMLDWRFYHSLRTDAEARMRRLWRKRGRSSRRRSVMASTSSTFRSRRRWVCW